MVMWWKKRGGGCLGASQSPIFLNLITGIIKIALVWALENKFNPTAGNLRLSKVRNCFGHWCVFVPLLLLFHLIYCQWCMSLDIRLLLFRAIWGSRSGVHCTCWRPDFDLQVVKFIRIHGYSSISPDPLHSQLGYRTMIIQYNYHPSWSWPESKVSFKLEW